LYIIIAELEQFVIPCAHLEVFLSRLLPGFFYLRYLIFYALPVERPGLFSVGVTGIAAYFKVVVLHPTPL